MLVVDHDPAGGDFRATSDGHPADIDTLQAVADWDATNRCWWIPGADTAAVAGLAGAGGATLTDRARKAIIPTDQPRITLTGDGRLQVDTFGAPAVAAAYKHLPGVETDRNRTLVDPDATVALLVTADLDTEQHLRSSADARALLDQTVRAAAAAYQASRDPGDHTPDRQLPGVHATLFPWQLAALDYIDTVADGRVLLGDDAGMGKTLMSLAAAETRTAKGMNSWPIIVIAKASLRLNWAKEIERFTPHRTTTIVTGQKPEPIPPADVVIVNYDLLHHRLNDLLAVNAAGLIIDESQLLKGVAVAKGKADTYLEEKAAGGKPRKPPGSWRTWATLRLAEQIRANHPHPLIVAATGTPTPNGRHIEFAPQLAILGHIDQFGGHNAFDLRYCGGRRTSYGWKSEKSLRGDELGLALRASCMVRRLLRDTLHQITDGELPPIRVGEVDLELDTKTLNDYRAAERDLIQYLARAAAENARTEGTNPGAAAAKAAAAAKSNPALVRISTLRQLASKAKLPAAIDWITQLVASEKAIVFAWYRDTQHALCEAFPDAARLLSAADQTPEEQEENKARFQTDPDCRLMIASLGSASAGHTLTAAWHVVFYEMDYQSATLRQAVGRAYGRANDPHGVFAWILSGAGTIDEDITELVDAKQQLADIATGTFGERATLTEDQAETALLRRLLKRAGSLDL